MKIDLPDLDIFIHHQVDARLRELNEMESHHGNNILPRMPVLQYVLRHEKVHGALTSLMARIILFILIGQFTGPSH